MHPRRNQRVHPNDDPPRVLQCHAGTNWLTMGSHRTAYRLVSLNREPHFAARLVRMIRQGQISVLRGRSNQEPAGWQHPTPKWSDFSAIAT